jgi:hypothetical protein
MDLAGDVAMFLIRVQRETRGQEATCTRVRALSVALKGAKNATHARQSPTVSHPSTLSHSSDADVRTREPSGHGGRTGTPNSKRVVPGAGGREKNIYCSRT